jgi:hypothetical protein
MVRILSCLLVVMLAAASSRIPNPRFALVPKSESPRPTRRALIGSTVATTVETKAEPVRVPRAGELSVATPSQGSLPVSFQISRRLTVQGSQPEYLRPFSPSSPSDFLSPPRV